MAEDLYRLTLREHCQNISYLVSYCPAKVLCYCHIYTMVFTNYSSGVAISCL